MVSDRTNRVISLQTFYKNYGEIKTEHVITTAIK